jgi:hypothetical protein
MDTPEVSYLRKQILNHISLFFDSSVRSLLDRNPIRFVASSELAGLKEKAVAIPYDIPIPNRQEKPYSVRFNGTELTLWNRITVPLDDVWEAIPNASTPLWYRSRQGTLIPAWNLFGNLSHLLTFGEERGFAQKDRHGRFAAAFSPRLQYDLLEIPAFNEAVAAVVGGCVGLHADGQPSFDLSGLVKSPVISLSHDCDILRGNDLWTQSVRGVRMFLPLARARPPAISNLWWIARNAVAPRRYYFDNVLGMIDLERCFGFNSTFYLLNGRSGRFGARSGLAIISDILKQIPKGWDIGMHYNYDTFLESGRFEKQRCQLERVVESEVAVGRAHYLRFDPASSFTFLLNHGIRVDESSGYADRIGYRNGIAGCFQAYDTVSRQPLYIWEMPLAVMDAVLVKQHGSGAIEKFSRLIGHLGRIGGALSIVFHPGEFFNPERREMMGVYHKILIECRQAGAVSATAAMLAEKLP